ncbi:MAG: malectin domain-containing carbohydrate-binding protein [Bacteroidota bacterium]
MLSRSHPRLRTLAALVLASVLLLPAPQAEAQVSVQQVTGQLVITSASGKTQRLMRGAQKNGNGWIMFDEGGFAYTPGAFAGTDGGGDGSGPDVIIIEGYQGTDGGGDGSGPDVIIIDGYQGTDGGGDGSGPDVIIIDGYQDVLSILSGHGAVIYHDDVLDVDVFTFPDIDEPLLHFFTLITTLTHNDRPLVDYLRLIEIPSLGVFDIPNYAPIAPPAPMAFPNDALYPLDWSMAATGLDKAQWYPANARKRAKVSLIDSGVAKSERGHNGLDGTKKQHISVAPTSNQPTDHALGLMSLLADRGNEAEGIVGLLGNWGTTGCFDRTALTDQKNHKVFSLNVGDIAPVSFYVAQAIVKSIEKNVDVINLSMRLAYSPLVEEAIEKALDAGIVVVAAAGNYPESAAVKPTTFPASVDGVIAVGSSQADGTLAPHSATGFSVMAPGVDIVVGGYNGVWRYVNGTSFAAAYVTAAASLVYSVNPNLSPAEVKALLESTSRNGHLDAVAALNAATSQAVDPSLLLAPYECLPDDGAIRINTGGEATTSGWGADDMHTGNSRNYTTSAPDAISRTTASEAVYRSERYGKTFSYEIPVQSGMTYDVKLHFAEIYWKQSNKRVFSVDVEDQGGLTDYDIFDEVGGMTAVVERFDDVAVWDDALTLSFTTRKDNAKIAAIEVIPTGEAAPDNMAGQAEVTYLNGGPSDVTVGDATWLSDAFLTGSSRTYNKSNQAIAGTDAPVIYQSERYGDTFGYAVPVDDGSYTVRIHLAEIYFADENKRVFSIDVEDGAASWSDIDLVRDHGAYTAVIKEAIVAVTDGTLDIAFTTAKNNAKVAGIEIIPVDESAGKFSDDVAETPEGFVLEQNYPNPFNPSTQIRFTLGEAQQVSLKVYDMLGREVATLVEGRLGAGTHAVTWDAAAMTSGTYLYRLVGPQRAQVQRMTLLK